jgi:hypothetical protein
MVRRVKVVRFEMTLPEELELRVTGGDGLSLTCRPATKPCGGGWSLRGWERLKERRTGNRVRTVSMMSSVQVDPKHQREV